MQKDVWNIEQELPTLEVEAYSKGRANLYFHKLSLPWFKQLTKLAVLVKISTRGWGLRIITSILGTANRFCEWLVEHGYVMPSALRMATLQEWALQAKVSQKTLLQMLLNVLYKLNCLPFQVIWKNKKKHERGQTISENVKQQLDTAFEELDAPIYLIFKLHEALATRSIELSRIPLNCLREREGKMRILVPTGKQDSSLQEQDLPAELTTLVKQQQQFIREKFSNDFSWLFANWKRKLQGPSPSWPPIFVYKEEQVQLINRKLNKLLKQIIKENNIQNQDGQYAHITTHQFRRTYGTVAYRMGKRTDQIKHGLRHLNHDMQDAYVFFTPQEQEKKIKVFVNQSGQRIVYKIDTNQEVLRREWQLRQTELGLCLRPSIIKDCEYEHICLGCNYAHYTSEHLPLLRELREKNQQLLTIALETNQADSRRAHSARQQINTLSGIIVQLEQEIEG
ncbi:tyrosine-type recombinase/integrase [Acaryochloris marina]|uniref:tyrosine-type recombinase/integrase n=1 Tax=Acaryochloris marina TaxID=155978 RepID=UPI0021C416F3|nr:tyrosine-type recombinase/integrase [Acaryochloris marina]